jgi:hemerythrin superfamily protein
MGIVPTDDLISLLAQDHEAIRERFFELGRADPDVRGQLFWELMDQLVRHEAAEEVVVYPALRQEPGGVVIAEARRREESEAEHVLARLEKLDPTTEEFRGAIRDLQSAVQDHAQKEEAEVFPLLTANEECGYLALLGQKFKGEKLAAPTHSHARHARHDRHDRRPRSA